jgi:hypothetical protein
MNYLGLVYILDGRIINYVIMYMSENIIKFKTKTLPSPLLSPTLPLSPPQTGELPCACPWTGAKDLNSDQIMWTNTGN